MTGPFSRPLLAAFVFIFGGCAVGQRGLPPTGPIPNFGRVNAELYRGAQPDGEGLRYLRRLGVQTIVNLRMHNEALTTEAARVRALGMTYVQVPMSGFKYPRREAVARALAAIEKSPKPVFVHCRYGCDRTGTVVACYRMRHGWTAQKALAEASTHGLAWWQVEMKNFIRGFSGAHAARSAEPFTSPPRPWRP